MKIAIAAWNGRVSPVFDVTRQVMVLEIENGKVTRRSSEAVDESSVGKIQDLSELRVDTLLCGAVSEPVAEMLAAKDIRVVSFIAGDVEEVLASYLARQLPHPAFTMPGCYRRRRRLGGGRRGRGCSRGRVGWS